MPNGYSSNPFDTIPQNPQDEGPLRAAWDFGNALARQPADVANDRLAAAGFGDSASRPWSMSSGWQNRLMQGAQANMGSAANPYSEKAANQARAAQMALIQQMRGQMNGPSLAGMQGQQAMAQSGQQALRMGANPSAARAAMLNAQQVGGGMAGDVARARLAEVMRSQAGMGGLAGNVRGADQQTALQSAAAQLEAQKNRDAMARFYTQMGVGASLDDLTYQLDRNKIANRVLRGATNDSNKAWGDVGNTVASLFAMGMKGG